MSKKHLSQQKHVWAGQWPYLTATVFASVLAVLLLFTGPKGQVNLPATSLLAALPIIDALRQLQLYRRSDEYQRTVLLKSVALTALLIMAALLIVALVAAASVSEQVAPLTLIAIYLGGYALFLLTHWALTRQDAQE
jgi:hypothetical protein